VEFLFPDGELFKHFDLKWVDYESMQTRPVEDEGLALRLREASLLTFEVLSGTGYGRCDLRMDSTGEIFLLEINPNCGIFYPPDAFGSADIILSSEPGGHRGFLEHLLFCARRRQQRGLKSWQLHYRRQSGFGLSATHDIAPGEVVIRYEEVDCAMVSRQHVERHWRGLKRQWFERYAWPVSENVFQLWSENPERWRPINHSCDPNVFFDVEEHVLRAIKDIAEGDELTFFYPSTEWHVAEQFDCQCGTQNCVGRITGAAHMPLEILQQFRLTNVICRSIEQGTTPRGAALQ